jgi:phosphatidylglycerophosphatase A
MARLVATWFGAGLLPLAPGTWGSLAALPVGYLLVRLGGAWALAAGVIAVFALGLWASGRVIAGADNADPGEVVIDEVAGQWLALLPVAFDWRLWPVAFVAFRLADIAKPWPVSLAERRLPGALGVMTDDLLAGVYAGLVAWAAARWLLP